MNLRKFVSLQALTGLLPGLLALSGAAWAQTSQTVTSAAGQAESVADLGYSARSAVLGPAFTAVADDTSALFENPAGLASLSRSQAAFHSYLGLVDAAQEMAVLGLPLGGGGGLGLAASYLDYGAFQGRDASGSLAANYSAGRIGLQAGWGMSPFPGSSVGLALHYSQQDITGTSYSFLTADGGVLLAPWKGWKIGLDYLAPGWGSLGDPLVSVFKAGLSWNLPLDPSFGLLTALGNALQSNTLDYLQAGLEASFHSTCFLRLGYQIPFNDDGYDGFSDVSMGAGLAFSDFTLDYAYTPAGNLSDSNRFSLTYYFGQPQEPANPSVSQAPSLNNTPKPPAQDPAAFPPPIPQGTAVPTTVSSPVTTVVTLQATPAQAGGPSTQTGGNDKNSLALHFDIPPDFTSQGEQMAAQGKYVQALQLYQQAVQEDPQNAQAWWDMGAVYYKTGQKTYAAACFQKVLELRPGYQTLRQWLEKYQATP